MPQALGHGVGGIAAYEDFVSQGLDAEDILPVGGGRDALEKEHGGFMGDEPLGEGRCGSLRGAFLVFGGGAAVN